MFNSHNALRSLLDAITESAFVMQSNGVVLLANQVVAQRLGCTVEEMVGRNIYEMAPADIAERRRAYAEQVLRTGEPVIFEDHRGENTILNSIYPIFNPSGEIDRLAIFGHDITERKRSELALEESEARFRSVFENATIGLYRTTPNGKILLANPTLVKMLGYTSFDELVQRDLNQAGYEPQYPRASFLERIERAGQVSGLEAAWIRQDGSTLFVRESAKAIRDSAGNIQYYEGTVEDITDRYWAEVRERETLSRLQLAMESAQEGVWEWDFTTGLAAFDKMALKMLGYEANRSPIPGEWWLDQIHPDECASIKQAFNDYLNGAATKYNVEFRLRKKDGDYAWIASTAQVIRRDRQGQPALVVGIHRDITERRNAEETLRTSESNLKLAQKIANIGNWSWIIADDQAEWSDQVYEIFQAPREKPSYAFAKSYVHPHDLSLWENTIKQAVEKQQPFALDYRAVRSDGDTIWVHNETELILDRQGHFIGYQGIVQDITRRKRIEQALEESEDRFRTVLENLAGGVFAHDLEGRLILVNQSACTNTGYSRQELLNMTVTDIDPQSASRDDREKLWKSLPVGESRTIQSTHFRKDGASYPTEIHITGIKLDGHRCILGVAFDITHRKKAEEQIRSYSEKLEEMVSERTHALEAAQERLIRQERLAVLGQLAGGVGHELRNPLGVIKNASYFLKLLLPEADEQVKEYLDLIDSNCLEANRIMSDLLDFSRIKSLNRCPTELVDLVANVIAQNPSPQNIITKIDLPADLPLVFVDPQQIKQIILNLITNAYQAMLHGGQLTVCAHHQTHSEDSDDRWVSLSIRDTGSGIAPENIDKIFEPLFTTKAKGIGLGLAISQKLAEANDAWIEVDSTPGDGATFTLVVPVYQEKP